MNSVLKVLSRVVVSRLACIAEGNGLLCREQTGFRTREECVGHATTLVEVAKKRQLAGLETFACFVDLGKAYDTVPHEGLLAKLKAMGIGGKLQRIIRAMYMNLKISVKDGGTESSSLPYKHGVRHGCVSSPILFDLFNDDLLKGCKGVYDQVPEALFQGFSFRTTKLSLPIQRNHSRRTWTPSHHGVSKGG